MEENAALELYKVRTREIIKKQKQDFTPNYIKLTNYENYKDILSEEDFKKALRLKSRKSGKRRRCFKKLAIILNMYEDYLYEKGLYCNLVFGTCTFNEKAIKLKEETRTKKVNKWLKEHFEIALANIDYGKTTEREHHHFIGITFEEVEKIDKVRGKSGIQIYELVNKNYEENYKLGFEPDLELIENLENEKKLSNYLVKINYHSNKKSAIKRRIRLIKKI